MVIIIASREHIGEIIRLEQEFFSGVGYSPEIPEAYELVLDLGRVVVKYENSRAEGMLATVPVKSMIENANRVLGLPGGSPLRERYQRGYFNGYDNRTFICAFVSKKPSPDLVRKFRELPKAVGFVNEGNEKALDFYRRLSCRIEGKVENIHVPGKFDYVLIYDR